MMACERDNWKGLWYENDDICEAELTGDTDALM